MPPPSLLLLLLLLLLLVGLGLCAVAAQQDGADDNVVWLISFPKVRGARRAACADRAARRAGARGCAS